MPLRPDERPLGLSIKRQDVVLVCIPPVCTTSSRRINIEQSPGVAKRDAPFISSSPSYVQLLSFFSTLTFSYHHTMQKCSSSSLVIQNVQSKHFRITQFDDINYLVSFAKRKYECTLYRHVEKERENLNFFKIKISDLCLERYTRSRFCKD